MLTFIKFLHTVIWAVMAGCVLALPVLGIMRRFRWAAILTLLVLAECAVLAMNGGRCPLTDWAARFTTERSSNFDIYLPAWLAHYNKQIFGSLFVIAEVVVFGAWWRERRNQT